MRTFMKLKERTAVVTGAANGIGRAIATSLAKRGCHLILVDVNEHGLAETKTMTEEHGVAVDLCRLDVSDHGEVRCFPERVRAFRGSLDLLVNNAGVALGGTFEDIAEDDFAWLMDTNFWSVVRMTRALLPLLRASDDARIVNICSLFGLISPPGQTAYSASKFAVRGFSNALRFELGETSVGVTVAHPGGVATSIVRSARMPRMMRGEEAEKRRGMASRALRMRPQRAGEIIVRAIEARRDRVLVGLDAKILSIVERVSPVSYLGLLRRRA